VRGAVVMAGLVTSVGIEVTQYICLRLLSGGRSSDIDDVIANVLADTGNAKHPREAVTTPVGRRPKARNRAAGIGEQRDRGGLSR
jgi:hypothetical protein